MNPQNESVVVSKRDNETEERNVWYLNSQPLLIPNYTRNLVPRPLSSLDFHAPLPSTSTSGGSKYLPVTPNDTIEIHV